MSKARKEEEDNICEYQLSFPNVKLQNDQNEIIFHVCLPKEEGKKTEKENSTFNSTSYTISFSTSHYYKKIPFEK